MYTQKQIKFNIAMYYLIQFFTGALFTIPVWVAYERGFLSYQQMSVLESGVFIVGFLFEIPSSAFADLFGRKFTVFLGWLISGIAYSYIGFSNNLIGLVAGLLIVGIGGALVSGADTALIYDFLKVNNKEDEYPKLNVYGNMFYRLSMIFAIYAGGYLSTLNLSYSYIARGVFELIALIPILLTIEVPFVKEKITAGAYLGQIKKGFSNIMNNPYVKDVTIYYSFVAAITWACLYYFNNTFANDAGYSPKDQSLAFTIIYIITTSILLYITNVTKLVEKTKLVLYGFPLLLILSLLPGFFATKTTAFLMLVGVVLAGGARFSILDGLLNKLLDSKDRATTLSTINMLVNVIFIGLMLIGGQVQQYYSTKLMFSIMGILCLVIALPYTRVIVRKHNL